MIALKIKNLEIRRQADILSMPFCLHRKCFRQTNKISKGKLFPYFLLFKHFTDIIRETEFFCRKVFYGEHVFILFFVFPSLRLEAAETAAKKA